MKGDQRRRLLLYHFVKKLLPWRIPLGLHRAGKLKEKPHAGIALLALQHGPGRQQVEAGGRPSVKLKDLLTDEPIHHMLMRAIIRRSCSSGMLSGPAKQHAFSKSFLMFNILHFDFFWPSLWPHNAVTAKSGFPLFP